MKQKTKDTILVLDGGHKKSLAIIRAQGKRGDVRIDVAASSKRAIGFFSRYTGHKIVLPSAKNDGKRFKEALLKILTVKKYLSVIPTDYYSFIRCSEMQNEINSLSHIVLDSSDKITFAANKFETSKLAKDLNIPVPKSNLVDIQSYKDLHLASDSSYVVKTNQETGNNLIQYFEDGKALSHFLNDYFKNNPSDQFIIQEKIEGDGFGFFAFYKNGECIHYFIHKRIREYPPSGGYSVAAEGVENNIVYDQGKKILDHLKWNGVAMVEFKYDNNRNEYYFLEINPKFWGSLDLSIANGRDFSQFWIDDARHQYQSDTSHYKHTKYQWLLNGELFHFLENPKSLLNIVSDMFYAKNDIWWRDPVPNLYQIANIPVHLFKKWFK